MKRRSLRTSGMLQAFPCLLFLSIWIVFGCIISTGDAGPYAPDDEALLPFAAMYQIDRKSFCLSEIAQGSQVRIERVRGTKGYNVMLHVYDGETSRTVAFVWEGGRYVWIGEQETHRSGRKYVSVDGELSEEITITYHERRISGGMVGLIITYSGDDKGVPKGVPSDLTCDQALSLIEEWDARKALPESN